VKFEFTVLTPTIQERINLCTLLKESLSRVGIIVNVKPVEFAVLQEMMQEHKFMAAFGGWSTGADPDTSENIWGTGEMRNFGYYSNPEVDRLFKEGRTVFERAERAERYAKIHEITYNDQPYMWLYFRSSFYAFSKSLRGYNFSPRGPYHYGPGFASIYKVKQ
jgi:peptide/nickel transport system substrate-binding protein